jgi:hypothetical protein
MLDAHQDGFSPAFCDDGAPPWAAVEYAAGVPGFPEPLAPPCAINNVTGLPVNCSDCGNFPWSEYYMTHAVGRAFQVWGSSTVFMQRPRCTHALACMRVPSCPFTRSCTSLWGAVTLLTSGLLL